MSLVSAIPESIKDVGRAKARGKAFSGQAYGQLISDLGTLPAQYMAQQQQQQQREQQARLNAQHEESNSLEIARQKREAAAEEAINGAMSNALAPDGSIDEAKLAQHLAGTPAASSLPKILQQFSAMKKTALDLRAASINAGQAEDDALGALAYASDQAEDVGDKAGLLAAGIASGIKSGTITPERGKALVASIVGDDGQPDPEKVSLAIKHLTAASKEQRVLGASDAQKEAAAESARALADERKVNATTKQLANVAKQLGATTDKAGYARVYAGLAPDMRGYFDAPDAWTKGSAAKAANVMLTPDQVADNSRADRQLGVSEGQLQVARDREKRLRANPSGSGTDKGVYSTEAKRGYDAFLEAYKARYPTERLEEVPDPYGGPATTKRMPVEGAVPPPSIEKWYAMTSSERQAVIADPKHRIDDAELARRTGGAPPTAAAQRRTVSAAQVKAVAKKLNISEAEAKKKAESEGFTVE